MYKIQIKKLNELTNSIKNVMTTKLYIKCLINHKFLFQF
jgi:hypothetical protein